MTQEDLNQIRAVDARGNRSQQRNLSATMRAEFDDRLTAAVVAIRQEFTKRLGAAAVSFSTDFSELRKELGQRLDGLERRMDALEQRMDRIAEKPLAASRQELAALTRWANRVDRENLELRSTQVAQQRAIDELAKRTRPPDSPPSELAGLPACTFIRDAGGTTRKPTAG